ncbi:hypothetical protein GWI33_015065 [Rhynchophorus ferrugineus]|uniref:Uncharacterized protein n=1 Tax=Rhynchophorus ferrugineus TaxID=354439 RepID=A0A834I0H0_RHYFE|nr:hypothetical protein GWI33_015065 [Rhynchophorus ferrugineus]
MLLMKFLATFRPTLMDWTGRGSGSRDCNRSRPPQDVVGGHRSPSKLRSSSWSPSARWSIMLQLQPAQKRIFHWQAEKESDRFLVAFLSDISLVDFAEP